MPASGPRDFRDGASSSNSAVPVGKPGLPSAHVTSGEGQDFRHGAQGTRMCTGFHVLAAGIKVCPAWEAFFAWPPVKRVWDQRPRGLAETRGCPAGLWASSRCVFLGVSGWTPAQFLDLELEVEAGCLCGLIKAHN